MRRTVLVLVLLVVGMAGWAPQAQTARATTTTTTEPAPDGARPAWKQRLDRVIGQRNVGVAVRLKGAPLYRHRARHARVPASNQKLLLTMAMLDAVDPESRMKTRVAARARSGSRVRGDLWLVGAGDPSVAGGGPYARDLPFRPSRLGRLARQVKAAGITRITGAVVGARSYYAHDWWAEGWRWNYPRRYAPLASALSLDGNTRDGAHVRNPELLAARALTRKLRDLGISVAKPAGTGRQPADVRTIAAMRSVPLGRMLQYMNRTSSNYYAEMMGKRLAVAAGASRGTISGGAAALTRWAAGAGVTITARDGSGLSYANRVSPGGISGLLDTRSPDAARRIRATLPAGGQGTLEDRLHGVRVRAKTGSLPGYSALSGYVYLSRRDAWASFSVLCSGMEKVRAAELEDRIVRILEDSAE